MPLNEITLGRPKIITLTNWQLITISKWTRCKRVFGTGKSKDRATKKTEKLKRQRNKKYRKTKKTKRQIDWKTERQKEGKYIKWFEFLKWSWLVFPLEKSRIRRMLTQNRFTNVRKDLNVIQNYCDTPLCLRWHFELLLISTFSTSIFKSSLPL
jgi:hypothetical protein